MWPDGKVYVGEAGKIWRAALPATGGALQREPLLDHLPDDGAHPLKELAFGPDGALYVNVGSSSDACRDDRQQQALPCGDLAGDKPRAAVYQAVFDGPQRTLKSFKPFATGLRNSLALAVLPDGPAKGTVLQGENSIDYPEGNLPPEELNVLSAGKHYGWPYCTGNREAARGYEKRYDCARSEAPLMLWPGHAAPLQMQAGPAGTPFAGQVLVAWHGYKPAGHRLVGYALDAKGLPAGKPVDWLAGWDKGGGHPLGKPTGFTIDRQGRLLVVEDFNRTVLMLLPTGAAPKK
jgi:glucose/arabinose dehydrogenase